MDGTGLKKKDLKRFRDILLAKKKEILRNAQRTLNEDMTLDADDLPDDVRASEFPYIQKAHLSPSALQLVVLTTSVRTFVPEES